MFAFYQKVYKGQKYDKKGRDYEEERKIKAQEQKKCMVSKKEKNVIIARFGDRQARVSEFECAVYKACLKIPRGKTATYKQIAAMIGKPNSARAVGNALGKNPFAPYVPCHRVLKSDGSIGGYSGRGGTATKKKLLAMEKKNRK